MIAETPEQDVEGADSSTAEIVEPEVVQLTQEDLQDESEVASEEVVEEVEDTEDPEEVEAPEPVETPTKTVPKVPLPRLQKEISKRKELQKQLDELRNPPVETQAPTTTQEPTLPTLASAGYDETAYQAAMATYAKDLVKNEIQASQAQAKVEADKVAHANAKVAHQNRIEAFMTESEGYQQVLQEIVDSEEDVEYPPAVAQAIELSDKGPELDYLILKNRDTILTKLQGLQPFQQLIELGRLEASLVPGEKVAKPKPISKAPAPIKSSSSGSRNTSEDLKLKEIYPDFKMY
jgi:hypothetical protein